MTFFVNPPRGRDCRNLVLGIRIACRLLIGRRMVRDGHNASRKCRDNIHMEQAIQLAAAQSTEQSR